MAGYSGTPLAKKLGFRGRLRVRISNAPDNYLALVGPLPEDIRISKAIRTNIDIWHFFSRSERELASKLPVLRKAIYPDGSIWISWPKKSSGVPSTLTEDTIRRLALPLGLVDVKVCAIDETWSGLKLVVRKSLRQ